MQIIDRCDKALIDLTSCFAQGSVQASQIVRHIFAICLRIYLRVQPPQKRRSRSTQLCISTAAVPHWQK